MIVFLGMDLDLVFVFEVVAQLRDMFLDTTDHRREVVLINMENFHFIPSITPLYTSTVFMAVLSQEK